jgi:hypothetical protein
VNQWDISPGGRIIRDRVWFYGTYRYADLVNGISRTDEDLAVLRAFRSGFEPFDNASTSHQPYIKVTAQLTNRQEQRRQRPRHLRELRRLRAVDRSAPVHAHLAGPAEMNSTNIGARLGMSYLVTG